MSVVALWDNYILPDTGYIARPMLIGARPMLIDLLMTSGDLGCGILVVPRGSACSH